MAKEHAEDALLTLVEIAKGNSAAAARVPAKFLNLLDFIGSGGALPPLPTHVRRSL